MDVRMPGGSGIEATARLAALHPEIPIVMLTASEDEDDLFTAIKAGARGYLLKDLEAHQLRPCSRPSSAASGDLAGHRGADPGRGRPPDGSVRCRRRGGAVPGPTT